MKKESKFHKNFFTSKIKLSNKIAIYTIIPCILVIFFISSITIINKYQSEKDLIMNRIDNYVDLLESGDLNYQSIADKNKIDELIGESVLAAGIVDRNTEILYGTDDFNTYINGNGSAFIENSLDGYIVTYSDTNQNFFYYSPIVVKNNVAGVLVFVLPFNDLNKAVLNYVYFIVFLDLVGILIASVLIRLFTQKTIVNKIKALEQASIKIKDGDYNNKIKEELLILKDEIGNLANSLETMRQSINSRDLEIMNLLKQKNEFINQLSHDLKTPLTPFVTLLPILEKRIGDNPLSQQILETFSRSTKRMKNMVDKTIKLARLNSSNISYNFKELNLAKEVQKAVKYNQFLFDDHNVEVVNMVDGEIPVRIDEGQMYEVFSNLFSNAVKYSQDKKGKVILNALVEGDEIIVSVKDDGIGMTSEQMKSVFNEFYKVDDSRHDLNSSGLGLSICKRIIEQHDGRIWVDSPGLGKGSTFNFTLPYTNVSLHKINDLNKKPDDYADISNNIDQVLENIHNT